MNILVYNRKGGSGKSTVADEIAFSFERSNIPTSFTDLDEQAGAIHEDSTDQINDAEIVIVDTPANPPRSASDWIAAADVIVIPTIPSGRDITMLYAAIDQIDQYNPDAKIIIVINRYNRYKAAAEFLDVLKELKEKRGIPMLTLPQAEAFQQAYLNRRSVVVESPRSNAAYRTLLIVNAVREAGGYPKDPVDPDPIAEYIRRQTELRAAR